MNAVSSLLISLYIALGIHGGESMNGYAPYYAKGVMDTVLINRGLKPASCNISSAYYNIGTWVWVWSAKTFQLRKCRISDVSAPIDKQRHRRTKRIIEFSYEDAVVFCGKKAMKNGPKDCPVTVIRINDT